MQSSAIERRRPSPDEVGAPGVAPEQLRYLRLPGVVLRVLHRQGAGWAVELLPGGQVTYCPDVKGLEAAVLADPAGLLMAAAEGCIPKDTEEILALAARDEAARGRVGLRLRDLEPYFEAHPALLDRADDIRGVLRSSASWMRSGSGSSLVYIRADNDWASRWTEEALPVRGSTEAESIDALKAALASQEASDALEISILGRICVLPWMPQDVRSGAEERLRAVLSDPGQQTECLKLIKDDALLILLGPSYPGLNEFLLGAPATSLRVRTAALDCLQRAGSNFSLRAVVAEAVRDSRLRVLAHLAKIAPDNLTEVVSAVFRLPPPMDEGSPEAIRYLREAVAASAKPSILTLLNAIGKVCSTVRPEAIERWLRHIHGASPVDVLELGVALATLDRLQSTHSYPALRPLAISRDHAVEGILRWFRDETAETDGGHSEGTAKSAPVDIPELLRADSAWVKRIVRETHRAFELLDREWLRGTAVGLAERVKQADDKAREWKSKAEDPDHASRVVGARTVQVTQAAREAMLESTRRQVEDERREVERSAALMVSEVLTAVGRVREVEDSAPLVALESRVEELAAGFRLRPFGRIGALMIAESGSHVGCEVGQPGTVRVVGVRNSNGDTLVLAKLLPEGGGDRRGTAGPT